MLRHACAAALLALLAFWVAHPAAAQNSTARGALIGGATGAVVGGAVTGTGRGALVGGALGAGTGAAIGASRNRNSRSYHFWRNGNCYYRQSNGRVLRSNPRHCRR
ncbi:glycine zipper domain-containing protein [Ancylobacter amanitiformis]|uniref:Uncharacterized protein YcfJ n=1 Tax=Ancylobacter amanitiformis TaxID=217069 RepID=A0ABU0LNF3_9HYPH|nr:glycine zipper domain-containing protein [Ancylobacter amanitiformis]MDQ0510194.1 uncharacterized protein YcfJ [Ancylobacter amanitiformis]